MNKYMQRWTNQFVWNFILSLFHSFLPFSHPSCQPACPVPWLPSCLPDAYLPACFTPGACLPARLPARLPACLPDYLPAQALGCLETESPWSLVVAGPCNSPRTTQNHLHSAPNQLPIKENCLTPQKLPQTTYTVPKIKSP